MIWDPSAPVQVHIRCTRQPVIEVDHHHVCPDHQRCSGPEANAIVVADLQCAARLDPEPVLQADACDVMPACWMQISDCRPRS